MKFLSKLSFCVFTSSILLAACSSTSNRVEMTEEERTQAMQMRQAFIERLRQGAAQQRQQNTSKPKEVELESMASRELLAAANKVTESGSAATFNIERDGILINDGVYLDPEGSIERAGWNVMTGVFTYVLKNIDGSRTIKYSRAGSAEAPLIFASIWEQNGSYKITTVDGHTLVGGEYIPTSSGVIVSRQSSLFKYEIGQKPKSISVPSGWSVATWQRGDVDSTNTILIEKNVEEKAKANGGFGGLLSGFSEIGKSFGMTEIYDYALLNIDTGKTHLLNMSLNDKNVTKLTNCQRQNDYVNKCSGSQTYTSLYNTDGSKNRLHYYWALDWFNTQVGPMAIYNSGSKLVVVDIQAGNNLTLFERSLGINWFEIDKFTDGRIEVEARLGFSSKVVEDLTRHISSSDFPIESTKSI